MDTKEATCSHSWFSDFSHNVASVFAAVLYGTCSVLIAFINKLLMTTYEFDFPVFIMMSQMLFTIIILEILSLPCIGIISMPRYTLERGRMFALPALFYGINSVLALSALSHMNIALYGVLKRCVPLVTMVLSVLILKKGWPSRLTMGSVVFLTLGCVVAGYGDLTFNLLGYTCGVLSNVAQSVYLLLVQQVTNGKLSTVESLQLNSINTLPFLAVFCLLNQEIHHMQDYPYFSHWSFIVVFFLAISLGCLLNYSLFLCTSLTSALTTSVVGGLKALAQTLLGIFTFGGVSRNISTAVGISMSVSGGLTYIFAKYRENRKKHTVDLRKIMSFSTAEDLKTLQENGKLKNGVSTDSVRSVKLDIHQHNHLK
ncbi:putative UDP-sugar transporter DDB_G0278631 [Mercenaria mercenaria]|uniref:putative UDP-sugar transporter DDB_G0278631 n=1 Tax=Mercenaria mercenaria TaxID=6596 RepID=UPI00234ED96B|nr:putative UDP-sugar transporter DDB_G0278631 [Mercenaria mercenaria]